MLEEWLSICNKRKTLLTESVQRLSSETRVRSGAIGWVGTATEGAPLNKPSAFSRTEEEFSDFHLSLTCFVGTMDFTLLVEMRTTADHPNTRLIPIVKAGTIETGDTSRRIQPTDERARTHLMNRQSS